LEKISLVGDAVASKTKFPSELSMNQWIQEQEKAYLVHKLKTFGGRIDLTARSCGVDARTIHRKMQIYGLNKKFFAKGRVNAGDEQVQPEFPGQSRGRFTALGKPQGDH
jgi:Bacterial regulatory protein, Fis family